jgi:putative transposase
LIQAYRFALDGTVVAEDLNVSGMLANRRLVVANRFYPSSKTCSGCGAVQAKLRLSERTYRCEACGLVLDGDLNAARNLAALAGGASSPSRGATVNEPAGNPQKTRPAGTGYRARASPRRVGTHIS